jgi:hypothetical protein
MQTSPSTVAARADPEHLSSTPLYLRLHLRPARRPDQHAAINIDRSLQICHEVTTLSPLPRSSRQILVSPPTSPASSRSIDFHARMSLSVHVALACVRYRMILGHGVVSEKNLHMLAVAIAIVCSTGDCRARRLICYSLSLLI